MSSPRTPVSKALPKSRNADRVVIALDATVQSLSVLEAAARLAVHREADLVALFIEDLDLFDLAALPFASEIAHDSGRRRQLDHSQLQRAMQRRLEQARSAMLRACEGHALRSSLQVRRGQYLREALSSTVKRDVLVLARMAIMPRTLGYLAKSPTTATTGPGASSKESMGSVWVLCDGTKLTSGTLSLAEQLAGPTQRVVIALTASEPSLVDDTKKQVHERSGKDTPRYQIRLVDDGGLRDVVAAMTAERAGVLVLPRDSPQLNDPEVRRMLESTGFPVVLATED